MRLLFLTNYWYARFEGHSPYLHRLTNHLRGGVNGPFRPFVAGNSRMSLRPDQLNNFIQSQSQLRRHSHRPTQSPYTAWLLEKILNLLIPEEITSFRLIAEASAWTADAYSPNASMLKLSNLVVVLLIAIAYLIYIPQINPHRESLLVEINSLNWYAFN